MCVVLLLVVCCRLFLGWLFLVECVLLVARGLWFVGCCLMLDV